MKLYKKIEKINDWITNNQSNRDPNMYEIFSLCIEIGTEASIQKVSLIPGKMPTNPELFKAYQAFLKMISLRRIDTMSMSQNRGNRLYNSASPIIKLLNTLILKSFLGEYTIPIDPKDAIIKKELLCLLAAINLYIRQQREKISLGKINKVNYNNKLEFEKLTEMYHYYINNEDNKFGLALEKGSKHPQFTEEMKMVYEEISLEYRMANGFFKENIFSKLGGRK